MLTPRELVAAIRFASAAGDRHHGHFDHDAHAAAGPEALRGENHVDSRHDLGPTFAEIYNPVVDPQTGIPSYFKK